MTPTGEKNKIRSGQSRKPAMARVALLAAALCACSRPDGASSADATLALLNAARPAKILNAYIHEGGICPLDSSEPATESGWITAPRGASLALNGWILPEPMGRQLPPMIFAVLIGENQAFYLEGKRVPRLDVAKGNHALDLAGFAVNGTLTAVPAGDYKLAIATGTEFVVSVCRTKVSVHIDA